MLRQEIDLGVVTRPTLQQNLRVSLDQSPQERLTALGVSGDQLNLASNQVFLVLEHEFRVSVNYLYDLFGLYLMVESEIVKETYEIAHFAG